jgi:uncharacterized protein YeaO (DUF488 family)
MSFRTKRVYAAPASEDGIRVLVDRLWPRGVRKEDAKLDYWMKGVAPSTPLRQWFGHLAERFPEFSRRYRRELQTNASFDELQKLGYRKVVTLLYGARDPAINHAIVLQSALQARAKAKPQTPTAGKDPGLTPSRIRLPSPSTARRMT